MKNEGGGTATTFRKKIEDMFSNCKQFGLNTVFVQIRPFADNPKRERPFPAEGVGRGVTKNKENVTNRK